MRPHPIMQAYVIALVAVGLAACVDGSSWSCHRSSQCPSGQFCRAGECVPAVGFISEDAGHGDVAGVDADAAAARCTRGTAPAEGDLVLNEVLVNVPTGESGDANGDGIRDAFDDEFVEIVNRTERVLDVTGVSIRNGSTEKFSFGPACLEPSQAAIVFGGGAPAERDETLVRVASSRFAFANGGGSVVLAGPEGQIWKVVNYEDAPAEALTLSPQLDGEQFVPHSTLSDERLTSPGLCAGGRSFAEGCE